MFLVASSCTEINFNCCVHRRQFSDRLFWNDNCLGGESALAETMLATLLTPCYVYDLKLRSIIVHSYNPPLKLLDRPPKREVATYASKIKQ